MKVESLVNLQLTNDEWESLLSIALVAYGSDALDLQDLAFAESLLIKGGAVPEDDPEDQPDDEQVTIQ
ncbi:MAG: hypothetical protein ACKO0Z_09355 [Betaproteobacteria bacterium]